MTNNALIAALVKTQLSCDYAGEGKLLKKLCSSLSFRTNGNDGKSVIQRFYEKIIWTTSDCWFWIGCIDSLGYGRFLHLDCNRAHRASWVIHNGPIPEGEFVLHKCDVRNCVNPEHLFLGTQLDNMRDASSKGRIVHQDVSGEKNPMAKLNWKTVDEIRKLYATGKFSQAELARRFKMTKMPICNILNNKTWKI